MRSLGIALLALLLLAPLTSANIGNTRSSPVSGVSPFAQAICEIIYTEDGVQQRCDWEARVVNVDAFRAEILGPGTVSVFMDLVKPAGNTQVLDFTTCTASCTRPLRDGFVSGQVKIFAGTTGQTGTVIRLLVGNDLSGILV